MSIEPLPKGGWKLKQHSFSCLRVWFKDGNSRTMYSLDWKHKYSKQRDSSLGLQRLRKLIGGYGKLADGAIIYDLRSGQPIEQYYEGERR